MADILYTYNHQVYANITNKCDCRCTFCIRSHADSVGDAGTLWHKKDPSLEEVLHAIDQFDFHGCKELVYCGYGEPTCALDVLLASASYARKTRGVSIRVNTNGLANLYHGEDIVPRLAEVTDSLSISLNAPTAAKYEAVTRPQFTGAFDALREFAQKAKEQIADVRLSVVDVLSPEDIAACQRLADSLGVPLRIRKYI